MSEKFVTKPSNDAIFKLLFVQNIDLLQDFLSNALDMPFDDFRDITIMNPELSGIVAGEKISVLDILVNKPDGTKLNIEMQNCDEGDFKERSVYYCSKLFIKNFLAGQSYNELPKTICINILQFTLFKKAGYKCSAFPTITETAEAITDLWQILYFQLPKLDDEIKREKAQHILEWLKFFTVKTKEDIKVMKETSKDEYVIKALEKVELMNEDEKTRRLAEAREEAILREKWILGAAKREAVFDVVRNMFSLGLSTDIIAKSTGVPLSEIAKLQH
ncbi:MAG: Rpn family recombination-promoting nuclease/putative transposase [Ruminococcus sp.]|jgi:predicted transposase/invertase (TIGR01784 family)|nr:Rpn family recombination-promoting nuclease/putative transposase [Ruminococcus sp.]